MRRRRQSPVELVDAWNRTVRVGDLVDYRGYPEAEPQRFQTRTVAQVLMNHTAVVWLDGKSGCVTVEACKPVEIRGRGAETMTFLCRCGRTIPRRPRKLLCACGKARPA